MVLLMNANGSIVVVLHIVLRHVTSRHVKSRHVTRSIISHHIISHHITSLHITSHHIVSYRIIHTIRWIRFLLGLKLGWSLINRSSFLLRFSSCIRSILLRASWMSFFVCCSNSNPAVPLSSESLSVSVSSTVPSTSTPTPTSTPCSSRFWFPAAALLLLFAVFVLGPCRSASIGSCCSLLLLLLSLPLLLLGCRISSGRSTPSCNCENSWLSRKRMVRSTNKATSSSSRSGSTRLDTPPLRRRRAAAPGKNLDDERIVVRSGSNDVGVGMFMDMCMDMDMDIGVVRFRMPRTNEDIRWVVRPPLVVPLPPPPLSPPMPGITVPASPLPYCTITVFGVHAPNVLFIRSKKMCVVFVRLLLVRLAD
mmetsp:Transcript_26325/g.55319  ORF Transcript_26325/g.55319 Transcript_26325/m.55319 type:complete len:365 (+) Transcript_26325:937-2031(+)